MVIMQDLNDIGEPQFAGGNLQPPGLAAPPRMLQGQPVEAPGGAPGELPHGPEQQPAEERPAAELPLGPQGFPGHPPNRRGTRAGWRVKQAMKMKFLNKLQNLAADQLAYEALRPRRRNWHHQNQGPRGGRGGLGGEGGPGGQGGPGAQGGWVRQ
ncbi:collagen alpha-1(XXVI) chain-like [Venturia canescens]|uniref:collagen alpha-1(XXVI) chain-like n=1 Tax=Venturia canescens TaxID=32260 RepID=UPI001C9D1A2E|nr:collagen alpha-1(XXVI) chain-like [Venturia canescens]